MSTENTFIIRAKGRMGDGIRIVSMNQSQLSIIYSRIPQYGFTGAVILAALLTSGCFENYGRLKHNDDVTRAFQTYQVEPDYKYYYYGRTNMPYAIVGIDRAYHMRSRVWREVDHDSEQFKEMIFWVWDDVYVPFRLSGAHITDPSGKKVGIWYSGIWYAAVRFEENNRIVIMPDTPFLGGPTR